MKKSVTLEKIALGIGYILIFAFFGSLFLKALEIVNISAGAVILLMFAMFSWLTICGMVFSKK